MTNRRPTDLPSARAARPTMAAAFALACALGSPAAAAAQVAAGGAGWVAEAEAHREAGRLEDAARAYEAAEAAGGIDARVRCAHAEVLASLGRLDEADELATWATRAAVGPHRCPAVVGAVSESRGNLLRAAVYYLLADARTRFDALPADVRADAEEIARSASVPPQPTLERLCQAHGALHEVDTEAGGFGPFGNWWECAVALPPSAHAPHFAVLRTTAGASGVDTRELVVAFQVGDRWNLVASLGQTFDGHGQSGSLALVSARRADLVAGGVREVVLDVAVERRIDEALDERELRRTYCGLRAAGWRCRSLALSGRTGAGSWSRRVRVRRGTIRLRTPRGVPPDDADAWLGAPRLGDVLDAAEP